MPKTWRASTRPSMPENLADDAAEVNLNLCALFGRICSASGAPKNEFRLNWSLPRAYAEGAEHEVLYRYIRTMMAERQISVALLVISAGLLFDAVLTLKHSAGTLPGPELFVGVFLGALGVFFGGTVIWEHPSRLAVTLGLAACGLVALALCITAIFGVLHSPGLIRRALFVLAAALPLGAFSLTASLSRSR